MTQNQLFGWAVSGVSHGKTVWFGIELPWYALDVPILLPKREVARDLRRRVIHEFACPARAHHNLTDVRVERVVITYGH